jgi:suppressor of ftsI
MNFSETTEAYCHRGILKATIVIEEKQRLVANQSVASLVYNGSLLGPTLHVKPGERMVVNYVNMLDQPTNLHFSKICPQARSRVDLILSLFVLYYISLF